MCGRNYHNLSPSPLLLLVSSILSLQSQSGQCPHSPSRCFSLKILPHTGLSFLWVPITKSASEGSQSLTLSCVLGFLTHLLTAPLFPLNTHAVYSHPKGREILLEYLSGQVRSCLSSKPPCDLISIRMKAESVSKMTPTFTWLHPHCSSGLLPLTPPCCSLGHIHAGPSWTLEAARQTPTSMLPLPGTIFPQRALLPPPSTLSSLCLKWNVLKEAFSNHPMWNCIHILSQELHVPSSFLFLLSICYYLNA